uniref:Teneurin NHL domain-containing protein n=1 Tax=Arcella intermedia TaxID=1963864 RepID=A0A6B2LEC5_9EUKA
MVLKGEAEFPDGTFLRNPFGICYSKSGDSLYVADVEHHRILSIKPDGTTKTLVGDYKCSSQRLCGPHDVIEEKNGLVIADTFSHQVKSFSFEDSKLSTLAGSSEGFNDGNLEEAKFSKPMGVTVDNKGNIYVCDTGNYKIRKVTPQGVVTTIAGSSKGHEDGLGKEAKFGRPTGIKYAKSGYLYVTDNDPPCLRKISPTGQVSTITGTGLGHADGPAGKSKFYVLGGLAFDPNTEELLVVDTYNNVIRRVQEVK